MIAAEAPNNAQEWPSERFCWTDKARELRVYGIPHGRLWRVYRTIDDPSMTLTLKEREEQLKMDLTFEEVLEHYAVKSRRGSTYITISCPNPAHDDKKPSCVIWPRFGRFRCYGCGAKGDVLELVRLLEEKSGVIQ